MSFKSFTIGIACVTLIPAALVWLQHDTTSDFEALSWLCFGTGIWSLVGIIQLIKRNK